MKTCWQIRQQQENGARRWVLDCDACRARQQGVSCWELQDGCPFCCASVDVTCDFCALYIEHRREIAALNS